MIKLYVNKSRQISWNFSILNHNNIRGMQQYENESTLHALLLHSAYLHRFVPHQLSAFWCKAPWNRGYFRLNFEMVQCCSLHLNSEQCSFGLLLVFNRQKRDKDCALYQYSWKHWNIKDFLFLRSILLSVSLSRR